MLRSEPENSIIGIFLIFGHPCPDIQELAVVTFKNYLGPKNFKLLYIEFHYIYVTAHLLREVGIPCFNGISRKLLCDKKKF